MVPSAIKLDDVTTVRFTVRFLLVCVGAIISAVVVFVTMHNDIANSLRQIDTQGHALEEQGKAIRSMQETLIDQSYENRGFKYRLDGLEKAGKNR